MVKNENLSFDDGKLKIASSDYSSGFGLRSVIDEKVGYAHSSEISKSSLNRAADTIKSFKSNSNKVLEISPNYSNKKYYTDINPISETPFSVIILRLTLGILSPSFIVITAVLWFIILLYNIINIYIYIMLYYSMLCNLI